MPGFLLRTSVAKSAARLYHKLMYFALLSRGVLQPPTVNHECIEEQLVKLLMHARINVKMEKPKMHHQILLYSGNPSVVFLNMNNRLHLTHHSVNQKTIWTTKKILSSTNMSSPMVAHGCSRPAPTAIARNNVGIAPRYSPVMVMCEAIATYMKMSSASRGKPLILYQRAPVRKIRNTRATQRHATKPAYSIDEYVILRLRQVTSAVTQRNRDIIVMTYHVGIPGNVLRSHRMLRWIQSDTTSTLE